MLRTEGGDFHATGIVRSLFSFQYALDLSKLPAYFRHHLLSGTTYCIHRQTTEEESHHGTDEHTHEHSWIHQVNLIIFNDLRDCRRRSVHKFPADFNRGFADVDKTYLDFLDI